MNDLTTSAKTFLTSDEKTNARLVNVLLIVGVLFGGYLLQDTILGVLNFGIALIGRTIMLGVMAAIAFFGFMTVTNPRFQTEFKMLNYRWVRWLSGIAMKSDPFGRMRAFANEFLQEQWNKFNDAATRIEAQKLDVERKIKKYDATLHESEKTVAMLQDRYCPDGRNWTDEEMRNQFRLESQRIKLTEDSLTKLRTDLNKLALLVKIVDRWRNTFKFEIESTRMTADFLEQQYNTANDTAGALEAASSAFGHGDMAAADKEVREYIEKLTSTRMAQADVLMKQIPELTKLGDLKGDVAEDEIMRRLTAFDSESQRAFVQVQEENRQLTTGDTSTALHVIKAKTAEPATRRYLRK